jgi:hypothetical protein
MVKAAGKGDGKSGGIAGGKPGLVQRETPFRLSTRDLRRIGLWTDFDDDTVRRWASCKPVRAATFNFCEKAIEALAILPSVVKARRREVSPAPQHARQSA